MQAALSATPGRRVGVRGAERPRARAGPAGRRTAGCPSVPLVAEALHGDFDVRMLPIDAQTFRNAYNGVANSTLWFVLHRLYDLPTAAVLRRGLAAAVGALRPLQPGLRPTRSPRRPPPGATVMVQDYHLFLVPRMLRELRPDVRIGLFTHTPWVTPDDFAMLPDDVARRDRRRHARRRRPRLPHRALGRAVPRHAPRPWRASTPTACRCSRSAPTPTRCTGSAAGAASTARCACSTRWSATGW